MIHKRYAKSSEPGLSHIFRVEWSTRPLADHTSMEVLSRKEAEALLGDFLDDAEATLSLKARTDGDWQHAVDILMGPKVAASADWL